MAIIRSSSDHLTLGADGASKDIIFESNGTQVASISSAGNLTSTGIDDNATSTAITIDSSENVGIGESSPDRKLHVNSGSSNAVAKFESTDTIATIEFVDVSGSVREIGVSGNNTVFLNSAGVEDMRIDSSGHAIIPAGVTLGTAAGTYAAANTLDDYEEGTWSPTLSSSTGTESGRTYSTTPVGTYVKVGKLVTCTFQIYCDVTGTGGTGEAVMRGIPFQPDQYGSGTFGRGSRFTNAINAASLDVEAGNVRVYLMGSYSPSTTVLGYLPPSQWGIAHVFGTITYTTA